MSKSSAIELLGLRGDAVHWRPVDGQVIAVDLRNSVYLSVNTTGALLWPDLAAGATREALIRRLTAAFGIKQSDAAADVDAFVDALAELDLLEARDPAGSAGD